MRKTIFSSILVLALFIFLIGPANATTVPFGDGTIYWSGHGNGTNDTEDVVGIPNITGGNYTITGSVLQSITFKYTGTGTATSLWHDLVPGDLFIDTDADGTWDYVAVNGSGTAENDWNLYHITTALGAGTDAYIMAQETGPEYLRGGTVTWASVGLQPRIDHPVGIELDQLGLQDGSVHFDGWKNLGYDGQPLESTFTFTDGLEASSDWIFGWTVNCGNDVIYEHGTSEAPIPGAVWLLSSGLLGLIGVRRRSRK